MVYTQIELLACQGEKAELLIAILCDIQFEGFEETETSLKAFINKELFDETLLKSSIAPFDLHFKVTEIAQQNWNADWESSFSPVVVEDFVAVRANFHQAIAGVKHDIVVTPKMSFGTGHHATTYMMMQQMRDIDFVGKNVFDFGTGTGVLAILAEKLGASSVVAIDNDEWSITNAKENSEGNGCTKVILQLVDQIEPIAKYDVVLANINLNVIVGSISSIIAICKQGTVLLFSGFLPENKSQICGVFEANGLQVVEATELNNWLCVSCVCA